MNPKKSGKIIAKLRGKRTQKEIAKALKISPSAIQMYEKQHMYDDDFDPSKSPYYAQLQQVLGLQQPGQPGDVTGGQKQLVNDEQGLSNKIMEMRQKMSKEEVQQALRNEGLGFYASWVP